MASLRLSGMGAYESGVETPCDKGYGVGGAEDPHNQPSSPQPAMMLWIGSGSPPADQAAAKQEPAEHFLPITFGGFFLGPTGASDVPIRRCFICPNGRKTKLKRVWCAAHRMSPAHKRNVDDVHAQDLYNSEIPG